MIAWVLVVLAAGDGGFDKVEAERVMRETPEAELIEMGRSAVRALGTYKYRMEKQERVKGTLLPAQSIETTVQESPFAVKLEFVAGPGKGRKVLYNSKESETKFRVREPGFLSIFGDVGIDVDSSLAKDDSNHTVKEAGMGNLLDRFARDLKKAEGIGGMEIVREGWNGRGHWCSMYVAPNGGKGFDAAKSRICTDTQTRLPTKIESYDAAGVLQEQYEFRNAVKVKVDAKFFDSAEF